MSEHDGERQEVAIRPLRESDLEEADRIVRTAFGTFLGMPDPAAMFGDADYVSTRYRADPEAAWGAEIEGELVGSVFAARWGSFAFFGPLTVSVDRWDRGVGSRLMAPVVDAFARWQVRQGGLFTFPNSTKHVGLYQKHGFWPRSLNPVMAKVPSVASANYTSYSQLSAAERENALASMRVLTDAVFDGLDLTREVEAVAAQGLGETLLLHDGDALVAMAICHCGPGSEAGSGTCYVKFAAARPGGAAAAVFEQLLDACELLAGESGLPHLVAGVNAGRIDAYRRMLARGFHAEMIGLAMRSRPEGPNYDGPRDYVIDDLR